MGDHLDELSAHLGPEYQDAVETVLGHLSELTMPERYSDVIRVARDAFGVYSELLDQIASREAFAAPAA